MRKEIPSLIYYLFVSIITSFPLIVFGLGIYVLPNLKPSDKDIVLIGILVVLYKCGVVGFGIWILRDILKNTYALPNEEFVVIFIGMYLYRFFGALFGAYVGVRIANNLEQNSLIGLIIGAVALYIAGRWIGSRVSSRVGYILDKVFLRDMSSVRE